MGLKSADVAATLQREYGTSRATAYRDVDAADLQRYAEDAGIQCEPVPGISYEDRDALMRMTRQLLITAYKAGNVQDYARLVREYERLARMGGLSQTVWDFVSHLRTSMKLTDNELALLADSIFWEMTFLEKKGWHTSQRAVILTDLQDRIHAYLDSKKWT